MQILVGAAVAGVLWIAATILFRLYVIHFNQFNKAYGTIGAVLLLLTWMYYSMVVVLAGGELNADLAGRGGPHPLDSVVQGRITTGAASADPSVARSAS
ncbi:MAG: hypothetical protein NVS9B3_15260 [Gemmatimonadaceae bacterium]